MDKTSDLSIQEDLRDLLKRCPPGTYDAALAFRVDNDVSQIEKIVLGIIDRHLEPEQREILMDSDDSLRMYEDLGMDSLTMLEIVMLIEQTLKVSIENEELRDLRTLGDVKSYLDAKAKGDYSKAKKFLKWKPSISTDELIEDMVEYELSKIK